ncbi:hypothetical protein MYA_4430 [Burkholderia sp. KJ006]|nr:hypothetical protein MYA_4430 [Burkholderia sp. KJ006]
MRPAVLDWQHCEPRRVRHRPDAARGASMPARGVPAAARRAWSASSRAYRRANARLLPSSALIALPPNYLERRARHRQARRARPSSGTSDVLRIINGTGSIAK